MKQNFLFRKLYTAASCLLLSASMFAQTTPVVWEGDGSADTPYLIKTADDLAAIATYTSQGVQFTNVHFKMTNDIDLSGIANWTPIGTETSMFEGIFDGNGRTVKSMIIDVAENNRLGLFGNIKNATIKNLTIDNTSSVIGNNWIAAFAGYCDGGSILSNLHNYASVTGAECIGGIIGNTDGNNTMTNCSNSGRIKSIYNDDIRKYSFAGGLAGYFHDGIIDGCTNSGEVSGTGSNIGGIIAWGSGKTGATSLVLSECSNSGKIHGCLDNIAGIVGTIGCEDFSNGNTKIFSCTNSTEIYREDVTTGTHSGGIVALIWQRDCIIDHCTNSGNVSDKHGYLGGIVGESRNSAQITNCVNIGNVTCGGAEDNVNPECGGIIGGLGGKLGNSFVRNCFNSGNISSNGYIVGGIIGFYYDDQVAGSITKPVNIVENCTNTGTVTAYGHNPSTGCNEQADVGGIMGHGPSLVVNCKNTGTIRSRWGFVGGIAGALAGIVNCCNEGDIYALGTEAGGIGGLLGYNWDSSNAFLGVYNSYTLGDIHLETDDDSKAGLLVGDCYTNVRNCYTDGTIGYKTKNSQLIFNSNFDTDGDINKYGGRDNAFGYSPYEIVKDLVKKEGSARVGVGPFWINDSRYYTGEHGYLLDRLNDRINSHTYEIITIWNEQIKSERWCDSPTKNDKECYYPVFGDPTSETPKAPGYIEPEVVTYSVSYNLNAPGTPSGMSAPMSQTGATSYKVSGVNGSVLSYVYNNVKYTFLSWNTKEDGTGVNYEPESMISPLDGDVTLYGVWKKGFQLRYALASDMQLSDFTALTLPVDGTWYDTDHTTATVAAPTAFTRSDGKVFAFWSTEPDGGGEHYEASNEITVTQDMVLYANVSNPVKQQIVIRRSGLKDGESAIYNIIGPDSYTATVVLTGDKGGSEVYCTIAPSAGLATGDYTVTETTWDWSYGDAAIDVFPASKKGEVTESSATGTLSDSSVLTFTFASTQKDNVAKHHESIKIEKL